MERSLKMRGAKVTIAQDAITSAVCSFEQPLKLHTNIGIMSYLDTFKLAVESDKFFFKISGHY